MRFYSDNRGRKLNNWWTDGQMQGLPFGILDFLGEGLIYGFPPPMGAWNWNGWEKGPNTGGKKLFCAVDALKKMIFQ